MSRQLLQLVSIHFKEVIRTPGIIFWSIFFPILMAWGLGIAFTQKGEIVRKIALINAEENVEISRLQSLTSAEEGTYMLTIQDKELGDSRFNFVTTDWEEATLMLKRGVVAMVIEGVNDSLVYHFDPLNPEAQLTYLQIESYLNGDEQMVRSANIVPLEEVGVRYIDFLIPGLIGMGIMMSCMWGISYGLIDKRMRKLMRRMVATPMKKSNFLAAAYISRLSINFVETFLLYLFANLYFGTQLQGSVPALILMIVSGNLAFTGIAILASSRTDNTQIGNGLINAVVMPMMILSGIFFPYHNFPDWAIVVIQKLPLTMLADGIRSVFIEGAGISDVLSQIIILFVIGIVFFGAGLRIYKWY